MSTIFSRIIAGDLPCERLVEDDHYLAFLDIRPIHEGHTLVIPKQDVDYFFDLDDELLGGIMPFARPVARALEKVVPCERVGVIVAGLEVPHAHVHLVPFSDLGQLTFANAREASADELAALAEKIRSHL